MVPKQHFNLKKNRYNLLAHKSFPGHVLSPFQFETLKSSGSEKAGQVRIGLPDILYQTL